MVKAKFSLNDITANEKSAKHLILEGAIEGSGLFSRREQRG